MTQILLNIKHCTSSSGKFQKEIARRMALECQGELSAQQILETIDTQPQNELAGDPGAIKQPGKLSNTGECIR